MPSRYGKWQTVFNRFRRWSLDGTWERILDHVVVKNDAVGDVQLFGALMQRVRHTRAEQVARKIPDG
jgi:transposase